MILEELLDRWLEESGAVIDPSEFAREYVIIKEKGEGQIQEPPPFLSTLVLRENIQSYSAPSINAPLSSLQRT